MAACQTAHCAAKDDLSSGIDQSDEEIEGAGTRVDPEIATARPTRSGIMRPANRNSRG